MNVKLNFFTLYDAHTKPFQVRNSTVATVLFILTLLQVTWGLIN